MMIWRTVIEHENKEGNIVERIADVVADNLTEATAYAVDQLTCFREEEAAWITKVFYLTSAVADCRNKD